MIDRLRMNFQNEFTILKEIANFTPKNYLDFEVKKNLKMKNRFFSEGGNFLKYCHVSKNILQIRNFEDKIRKFAILGIIVKNHLLSKISNFNNIIEVWLSSIKNFFKRTSLIMVIGEGEIWEFNFVKKIQKKNFIIQTIVLFGTSLWIFDIPLYIPQFFKIKKPFSKFTEIKI